MPIKMPFTIRTPGQRYGAMMAELDDITLTEMETRIINWLSELDDHTVDPLISIFRKLKGDIITEASPWAQELISIPDAAEILGIDPSALRHAIARGSNGLQPNVDYTRIGTTWVLHKNAVLRLGGRPAEAKWNAYLERRLSNQGQD